MRETYATNSEWLHAMAVERGISLRTLDQVRTDIAACKARARGKNANLDKSMARLMLRHGRLIAEARAWLEREYPQD